MPVMAKSEQSTVFHWILFGLGLLCLPWALGALLLSGGGAEGTPWWRWLLVLVVVVGHIGLWVKLPRRRRWVAPWMFVLIGVLVQNGFQQRSDRDWSEDQARSPHAVINGDTITIHNIRNFRYQNATEWTPAWMDAEYALSDLEAGYFIVEHFSPGVDAIAHTMVSFRFKDDRFLAVSVEIRKEKGETYSPLRGLFRQFELYYVMADEQDALRLRTHHRKSRVAIHRMASDIEGVRAYFMDIMARVNALHNRPEFYHTLTSSCTTNLARHLEAVTDFSVSWDKRVYLPGYSSELAWELGLLGEVTLEEALERDTVTDARRAAADVSSSYSRAIRGEPVVEDVPDLMLPKTQ